eukprot:g1483.t1
MGRRYATPRSGRPRDRRFTSKESAYAKISITSAASILGVASFWINEINNDNNAAEAQEDRDERSRLFTRNFIADAVEKAAPMVVNLQSKIDRKLLFRVHTEYSSGSGFIVSTKGLIVTNAHVVGNSKTVDVTLHDGRKFVGVVHSKDRASDLAIVRIVDAEGIAFPVADIGRSDKLRAGEWVVALGSPLMLQNTVTAGIISAVARQSSELGLPQLRTEYIQTDASINRGNSGGPLVDLDGKVIGVNTMKVAGAGISFAIPIDTAWQVVQQLCENGRVVRPYLGFSMVNAVRRQFDTTSTELEGSDDDRPVVIVVDVKPGSPAEMSGLRPGDVLVSFDNRPVQSTSDIHDRLGYEIGRSIDLVVRRGEQLSSDGRGGETLKTKITTEERKPVQRGA